MPQPMLPQVNTAALITPKLHMLVSGVREFLVPETQQTATAAPMKAAAVVQQQQKPRLAGESADATANMRPISGQSPGTGETAASTAVVAAVNTSTPGKSAGGPGGPGGLQGILAKIMASPKASSESAPLGPAATAARPQLPPASAPAGGVLPAATSLLVLQTELAALVAQMQVPHSSTLSVTLSLFLQNLSRHALCTPQLPSAKPAMRSH